MITLTVTGPHPINNYSLHRPSSSPTSNAFQGFQGDHKSLGNLNRIQAAQWSRSASWVCSACLDHSEIVPFSKLVEPGNLDDFWKTHGWLMVQKSGKLTSWYGKYPIIYIQGFYISQVVSRKLSSVPNFHIFVALILQFPTDQDLQLF